MNELFVKLTSHPPGAASPPASDYRIMMRPGVLLGNYSIIDFYDQ